VMEMTWRSPIRSQDLGILPLGTGLDHKLGRQFTAMAKFGAPQNCCRDAWQLCPDIRSAQLDFWYRW